MVKTKMLILSLLAGLVYPLGFAPFSMWPMALISVAAGFFLWGRLERKDALWSALLYGLGLYGMGVSWVYVSMVNFGNMQPLMAVIAVLLFALMMSLYNVLLVWVYTLFAPRFSPKYRFCMLLPSLWVIFESLRGYLFTGFSWLLLGYAGTDTWFSGWASIAGVLAISLVLAYFAGLLAYYFHQYRESRRYFPGDRNWRGRGAYTGTLVVVLLLCIFSWWLQQLRWTSPTGDKIDVTLVQADIPLAEKWVPENRDNIMQTYLAASRAVKETDLIVWPEGALPMLLDEVPPSYLQAVGELDAAVIFGMVERQQVESEFHLYNGLVLLDGAGEDQHMQVYRKRHLVPFGEFFPLQFMLGWLFESLQIPMSDFKSGAMMQENLLYDGVHIVPTICYEDAYPEDWRHQVVGSNLILNISEDAWFGDSLAPHQRLQMARMRAMEFQQPMIRVSNSGLSTVIDDHGEFDAISPQFQPALFNTPVFPMQGATPYAHYGRWPLWTWLFIWFVFGLWRSARAGGSKK